MLQGSDKSDRFLDLYDEWFEGRRQDPIRLLELGIAGGGSLRYWADYFPNGQITGLDLNPPEIDHPRIRTVRGDQGNPNALAACGDEFDIVIDDCAHIGTLARLSFEFLFPRVTPGGIYAIEDWGTGYWADWPDGQRFGKFHYAGMVGFVKDLVDMVATNDIDRGSFHGHSDQQSQIHRLSVINGLVIVVKA